MLIKKIREVIFFLLPPRLVATSLLRQVGTVIKTKDGGKKNCFILFRVIFSLPLQTSLFTIFFSSSRELFYFHFFILFRARFALYATRQQQESANVMKLFCFFIYPRSCSARNYLMIMKE